MINKFNYNVVCSYYNIYYKSANICSKTIDNKYFM